MDGYGGEQQRNDTRKRKLEWSGVECGVECSAVQWRESEKAASRGLCCHGGWVSADLRGL